MKTVEFVSYLQNLGVKLWIDKDRLGYRSPNGVMTAELKRNLVDRKTEILEFLREVQTTQESVASSIQPISREQVIPLSYGQQRLWFLEKMALSSNAYNVPLTIHLIGKLDYVALQKSLNQIIDRHETLRTTFSEIKGTPVQIIKSPFKLQLPIKDLTQLTSSDQTTQIQQLLQQENEETFNLEVDPPIRALLFQLGTAEHILQITLHHIASDGWSLTVLPKELSIIYTATLQNQPSPLPELPIQYADFAVWQKKYLKGETIENQLNYWKQKLRDLRQLQLPTDHPRPPVQTFNGAGIPINIPADLTSKLRKLTQKQGATLFITLLAAFKVLLYRYSGQESIAVGSPIANRNRSEIEGLIGFFVNSLIMHTDMGGKPSFTEVLNRVKQTSLEAYSHQDIPFEKLVEELQPERSLSQNPLFQVMFVVQQEEILKPSLNMPNLEVELGWDRWMGDLITVRMDLELHMWPAGDEIKGLCAYNRDLFEAETIQRMLLHYQNLLSAALEIPEQPINQLSLMTEPELDQILVKWNNTKTDYPTNKCIHQLFEEQVQKTPDAVAVVFEDKQLTYLELNSRANQLAHYLQSLGVKPEVLVGICLERSLFMIVGLLGILKAGGAYVPIDPTYPTERLSYLLEDAAVPVLLTSESVWSNLPSHKAQVVYLDSNWHTITAHSIENIQSGVTQENLAYTIYTSGSTGKPKGCMNTHAGIYNRLLWMQETYQLTAQDRILQKTPFSFDVSVWEFFWPLFAGATLVVASPEIHKDREALIDLIIQQQITTIHFVPSMLSVFLQGSKIEECSSLKRVICSGEALSYKLQEQFQEKLKCELHNLYGPTEAAIDVTFWDCGTNKYPGIVPIGRPIANTKLYILDKNNRPVPIGVPGELHIGGAGLARGYLNRPELTAEKFIPNPFDNNSKLYKTGDLTCYLPNGDIKYIGRVDHQVKIRGYRIETGEIEAIVSQYPDVKENLVIAQSDPTGGKRLVVYMVPKQESTQDTSLIPQVRQFLKQKLPEYMIPAAFVLLETFPLTPNGKINRRALPVPNDVSSGLSTAYVMPQTETQRQIENIWREVLKVEKVGIYDNFFELGGHSLLLIQVHTKLQEIYGEKISIVTLFQYPNISDFSQYLIDLEREQVTNFLTTGQAKSRSARTTSIKQQRLQRQKNRRNK